MSVPLRAPAREPAGGPAAPHLIRGLGLLGTVALCVGNMVGTSIYTLPASLAATTGPFGLLSWGATALGYLFVALAYASLGTRHPRTGGPYVFARDAFGDFAGFQTVWSYWVSCVIGNAAIATGVVGYAAGFSPALAGSVWLRFALGQAMLWACCLLNVLGVKQSARVQIAIMFLNIGPLVLVSLLALAHFDPANLTPFAPKGAGFPTLAAGVALVVWGYAGVESATVPAEEVRAPERTIRLGTMLGYAVGTCVFLLTALALAGALPNDVVAGSARPIALVAERTLGGWAGAVVGTTAMVAGLGTLNGWTLMAGRIPVSASADGIFFERLARIHPRYGTPHVALVVGTAVASATMLLYFSKSLLAVFNFVVLLAVLTTLLPHLYSAAAELLLAGREAARDPAAAPRARRARRVAFVAFAFVLFAIYGAGPEVVMWGTLVVLAGMPLYAWFKTREQGAGSRVGP
ncbi:MAG: APC family permease [Gemmatimonadaceae bacterium]